MTTYRDVDAMWPEPLPVPASQEAITGTKRLIRRAFALARGEGVMTGPVPKRKFKITSGRRRTWPRSGVWIVNPNERGRGWAEIVHSVSHWAQRRFWRSEDPHGPRHVWLERELSEYVIANFLAGQLARPAKTKPDAKVVRAARIAARIRAWEAKARRAETALRKLRRSARYYGLT